MKLGGIEGNAAAGEREPLLGPDVDVSIDRDRDPVDAGVDRPPESSPRELLNANVATEPRTKTKPAARGARWCLTWTRRSRKGNPSARRAAEISARRRRPRRRKTGGARGGGGGARGEEARAARLARAKAAREDAERRLATSTTLKNAKTLKTPKRRWAS